MGNSTMRIVMGIVAVMIAFVMFPMVLDGAHDIRTDPCTVTGDITTGVGELDGDVVFTVPLYNDTTANINTLTSDNVADTPVAGTYTAATNTLNVTGLAASDSRTITITYTGDATADYTGLGSLVSIAPLIIFVGLLFAGGLSVFTGIRNR